MIVREGEEEEMVGVGRKTSVLLRPLGKSVAEAWSNGGDMIVLGFLAGSKATRTSELPQN